MTGQLAVASTLWIALAALGVEASLAVVLLVIPVAKLGGVAPTPGGFGSTTALLTALLVATVGVEAAVAGAAAFLYRLGTYWLPAVGGGVAAAWYALTPPASRREVTGATSAAAGTARTALLVVSGVVVALFVGAVHGRGLLVEPTSPVVHAARDGALVVLCFGLAWGTLRGVDDLSG
ncbi:hypothetical protein BRD18_02060 [Halobacteriales archaeon SW_7_71_33]|nr:MAG: hypothetical protein BRD18_02060 [Halobacteriales archaeon SW_7_71_33]